MRRLQDGTLHLLDPDAEGNPEKYAIMPSIDKETKWSWSRFGNVNVSTKVLAVVDSVERAFASDKDISAVSRHDDFPFSCGAA